MVRCPFFVCLLFASTSPRSPRSRPRSRSDTCAFLKPIAVSLLEVPPDNDGIAGARLATEDNNATGKFVNQRFLLEDMRLKEADDPAAAVMRSHGG